MQMDATLVRYAVVTAFVVLVLCAALLRASHATQVPAVLNVAAVVFGLVLMSIPTALVLNDLLEAPLTPGAWLLFWVSVPASVFIVALTAWSVRSASRSRRDDA